MACRMMSTLTSAHVAVCTAGMPQSAAMPPRLPFRRDGGRGLAQGHLEPRGGRGSETVQLRSGVRHEHRARGHRVVELERQRDRALAIAELDAVAALEPQAR